MSNFVEIKKVYARTLDPVHIGEGGYRLGRVDNTIVRDPATDVPKIPGTSMAGVTKEFYIIYLMETDKSCKNSRDNAEEEVKSYFGDEQKQGMIRFYDGQIIFFPVSSSQGTVWITTRELLEYWFEDNEEIKIILNNIKDDNVKDSACAIKGIESDGLLNLGWILLEVRKDLIGSDVTLPDVDNWVKKVVVVSDKLFSHIVNDNLEIRTSVRIDPETGTAEEGALFTYEAIPRGTVLGFEIGIDKRKNVKKDVKNLEEIISIIDHVSPYFKLLGIGGMGTRGFGRIELKISEVDSKSKGEKADA
ncbi:type III-B CRISPR module RAMP protein Cmr4 [Caldanaerobius polysaccharolyticus]|uniref:type III-B CRISPR module RAMP protein Cmr4 n=1 Tax=Caldanaerobius polysaccharolyticus TaxID=44256 RepID=UPI00047C45FB|nr:type III-B CRISPR module RAMP protein Cmr4 [Caldanaerobius polysaccharolyticus]